MQRGIVKHFAHVLPRMFAERILWGADLRRIKKWGEGHLWIDVTDGTCRRDDRRSESLWISRELQAWLAAELEEQHDAPDDVRATLDSSSPTPAMSPGLSISSSTSPQRSRQVGRASSIGLRSRLVKPPCLLDWN